MLAKQRIKQMLLASIVMMSLLLCACAKNPAQDELYAKLLNQFTAAGYSVSLAPVAEGQEIGIADASRWLQICLDSVDETPVLVYFDESNRADYLKTFVDAEQFGLVTRYGQRFVLTYSGTDQQIIDLLKSID